LGPASGLHVFEELAFVVLVPGGHLGKIEGRKDALADEPMGSLVALIPVEGPDEGLERVGEDARIVAAVFPCGVCAHAQMSPQV
jgi:hypothetical protein